VSKKDSLSIGEYNSESDDLVSFTAEDVYHNLHEESTLDLMKTKLTIILKALCR
jgi:hypothetical protein